MTTIYMELATRCKMEELGESAITRNSFRYRFDTVNVAGDYTIIELPLPFANETTARHELYKYLCECFK